MTFPINVTIPNGPNVPSTDVPPMRTNFANISGFLGVDHTAPGAANAGTHQQVTFLNVTAPAAPTSGQGVLYTLAGVAAGATTPNLIYQNQNVTVPVNLIKAWAYVTVGAGPLFTISFTQNSNVTNVVRGPAGTYTVTLAANTVGSANYGIISSSTRRNDNAASVVMDYSITNATTFILYAQQSNLFGLCDVTSFSFIILQV